MKELEGKSLSSREDSWIIRDNSTAIEKEPLKRSK